MLAAVPGVGLVEPGGVVHPMIVAGAPSPSTTRRSGWGRMPSRHPVSPFGCALRPSEGPRVHRADDPRSGSPDTLGTRDTMIDFPGPISVTRRARPSKVTPVINWIVRASHRAP